MANSNSPFGFKLIGLRGGVAPNFELIPAKIASNNTTKIYHQDPVKMLNTGYIDQWTASTAVSQLWGIFHSCKYYNTSVGRVVNSPFWPGANASGDITAYLVPCVLSPAPTFLVQSSGTAISQADVGANVDVAVGTGSTVGGCFSGASIDQGTLGTTATLPFRIVGLYSDIAAAGAPGSDAASYNWAIVAANVSGAGSTGV